MTVVLGWPIAPPADAGDPPAKPVPTEPAAKKAVPAKPAAQSPPPRTLTPGEVDPAPYLDHMGLLEVLPGKYVATEVHPAGAAWNKAAKHVFYGDGKTFYDLARGGGSASGTKRFSASLWDARFRTGSELEFKEGVYTFHCGDQVSTLRLVPMEEARPVLAKARFFERKWKRKAYLLARDDTGRYIYVDRKRKPYNSMDFRIYAGVRGNMKALKLKNVVSDAVGDLFITSAGTLKRIHKGGRGAEHAEAAFWIKGRKRTELDIVPIRSEHVMIYRDLGVYEGVNFGTPCDDL